MCYGVVPVSGLPIKNQLVISDRPSLHTIDVAVDEGPIKGKRPSRPIIEAGPEGEYSVLKPRIWGGRISAGPTSEKEWVLGFIGDALHDHDPFFPPVSLRWEMGGVSGSRGDLVREVRSSGPRTVINDRGDASSTSRSRGWSADDKGE